MTSDSTVVPLRQPEAAEDPLTAVLRNGARRLLAQAIEAEAEAFLAAMKEKRLPDGRDRVVRHGLGPERTVQTGIGPVAVRRVKLRDRDAGKDGERIRFTSAILPRWARRTRSLDALLPVLYLHGVAMGDFQEALGALLGKEAPNLSPAVLARLRDEWEADHARWQRRDLSARRYVYLWVAAARSLGPALRLPLGGWRLPAGADGAAGRVHAGADRRHPGGQEGAGWLPGRPAREHAELAGAAGRPQGTRPGHRARAGHWRRRARLLDGARGGLPRHQRCWVHKTANVLNKLPRSVQPAAKRDLREIWQAPDRATAEAAIAIFAEKYGAKYEKAVACLTKDREALLTFYDFPAEHWDHLRTSNPIESVFATVRHRTVRTKGALSQDTARLMVFKLVMAAAKTWRRLKGENQLPKVIQGVRFRNGVEVTDTPEQTAA